jgi:hypothetical protein
MVPAAAEPMGQRFVAALEAFAAKQQRPPSATGASYLQ